MNGSTLIDEIARRLAEREERAKVPDTLIATFLGITPTTLNGYRDKELTPRQMVNLIESHAHAQIRDLVDQAVVPIVEFMPLVACQTMQKKNLAIVQHDARGQAKSLPQSTARTA